VIVIMRTAILLSSNRRCCWRGKLSAQTIDPKEMHNTLQMLTEKMQNAQADSQGSFVFRKNLLQQWARNEFFEFDFIEHAEWRG
jgi:hypothetical protein